MTLQGIILMILAMERQENSHQNLLLLTNHRHHQSQQQEPAHPAVQGDRPSLSPACSRPAGRPGSRHHADFCCPWQFLALYCAACASAYALDWKGFGHFGGEAHLIFLQRRIGMIRGFPVMAEEGTSPESETPEGMLGLGGCWWVRACAFSCT